MVDIRTWVIVSRHPAVLKFIEREMPEQYKEAKIITEDATAYDVVGCYVIGNLPLYLASLAKVVYTIEFVGNPPRGKEYTLEEMDKAGASIGMYAVKRISS